MRNARMFRLLFATAVVAGLAAAQTQQFPFQMVAVQGNSAVTLANGGQISFNSQVGQSQSAQVTATFDGVGQATITGQPSTIGSTAFKASLANTNMLPLTLNPGDS